ncbi:MULTISPECIES: hypothetical protein [Aneurinibacillus]|jgi:hypothetical protein|uniref:Uncharacterized protein n=1 Tax=Aneurinibacillus danicus TaxID=267746 RepID=A0A511VFY4_9BACL|nr:MULTISPECIES: hypothetical protein [Aneurinibacillus]GEN36142.1 hypothetical protein ADA01nite_36020 [Aneurinibacillus danicus]
MAFIFLQHGAYEITRIMNSEEIETELEDETESLALHKNEG